MHLREMFNRQKENREARRELATFLRNKARTDESLGMLERSRVRMAAGSAMIQNHLLGKVADYAEERGEGEVTPDQLIDFLKRFFEEVWPLLLEAIKSIMAFF
jgi:hypothetical protein